MCHSDVNTNDNMVRPVVETTKNIIGTELSPHNMEINFREQYWPS